MSDKVITTYSSTLVDEAWIDNYRILIYRRYRHLVPFTWHVVLTARFDDNGIRHNFRKIYRLCKWQAFNAACRKIEKDKGEESYRS
jgi:hypothetical protein